MSLLTKYFSRNIFKSTIKFTPTISHTKYIFSNHINIFQKSYLSTTQQQEPPQQQDEITSNTEQNQNTIKSVNLSSMNVIHEEHDSSLSGDLPLTELVRDFLSPEDFFNLLHEYGHDFFAGVPDSLLKDFCAYVTDNTESSNHIITPNEGNAIALAAGYHLGTGKIPVVYLQNSGLGNAVNPLLSLTDRKVCNIPLLLLIGWRGEPGRKDEPQHLVQGKITTAFLADMNIPFEILPDYIEGANEALETAQSHFQQRGSPYCLLVRKRTFSGYKLENKPSIPKEYTLSREEVLDLILENTSEWDAFVCTTGFTSRELYELRKKRLLQSNNNNKKEPTKDLLMVGSMGHASSIALGVALSKPSRNIITLDGDGALLMHTGILSTVGSQKPKNYKHILINNGVHDSVGQQPTTGFQTNWCDIVKATGYTHILGSVSSREDIINGIQQLSRCNDGPAFLEIKCKPGSRKDLGRPKETPQQNKRGFMEFLRK